MVFGGGYELMVHGVYGGLVAILSLIISDLIQSKPCIEREKVA